MVELEFGLPTTAKVDQFLMDDLETVDTTAAVMTNNNLVFTANTDPILEEEELNLNMSDVMGLIHASIELHPDIVTMRPYEAAIESLSRAILEDNHIDLDMTGVISESDEVKEFLFLLFNGFIATKETLATGKNPQSMAIVFTPKKMLSDPSMISVGGVYVHKGRPVITMYTKASYDDMTRKTFDVGTPRNVVDVIMESPDAEGWKDIKVGNLIEFEIQVMSNLEIATMITEGAIDVAIVDTLPKHRQSKVEQLLGMMGK